MPEPTQQASAGRVIVACAVALALLAVLEMGRPGQPRDDRSFGAGYAAASDRTLIHVALASPGVTSASFCGRLYEVDTTNGRLVKGDFLDGCARAVVDVME